MVDIALVGKLVFVVALLILLKLFERRFLNEQILQNKQVFALVAGAFFTIVGFVTSYTLFEPFVGLATILFTVILALPTLIKFFEKEEAEQKEGASFLTRNEYLIDFYLYFFIGSFMVFFVLGIYAAQTKQSLVFSLEDMQQMSMPRGQATEALPAPPAFTGRDFTLFKSIFNNNLYVMIISFVLSLFYGAGSLFLITFNGSIFASTLAKVIMMKFPKDPSWYTYTFYLFGTMIRFSPQAFWVTSLFMTCNLGIMFFHGIPEVLAYFFAAIAGGVLSEGFLKEKNHGEGFPKLLRNALLLLLLAIIVLFFAAGIEVYVSKRLFVSEVCVKNPWFVNSILFVLIAGIVAFEVARTYLWRKVKSPKEMPVVHENKQLTEYIVVSLGKGFSESTIKRKMKDIGYSDDIIAFHLEKAKFK